MEGLLQLGDQGSEESEKYIVQCVNSMYSVYYSGHVGSPRNVYPQDCTAGLSGVNSSGKEPVQEAVTPPQTDSSVTYPIIQGRLRERLAFWETLQPPPMVLDIVKGGYILPFFTLPTPAEFKNHASAVREGVFVKETIDSLLENRCIEEVAVKPTVCSPLSVVISSSGKKRLVIDLTH